MCFPAFRDCDGGNIVKKSGIRKGRYLLSFPGIIDELTAGGGACGTLIDMDTQQPSLVLQLPEVRCILWVGLYGARMRRVDGLAS